MIKSREDSTFLICDADWITCPKSARIGDDRNLEVIQVEPGNDGEYIVEVVKPKES